MWIFVRYLMEHQTRFYSEINVYLFSELSRNFFFAPVTVKHSKRLPIELKKRKTNTGTR